MDELYNLLFEKEAEKTEQHSYEAVIKNGRSVREKHPGFLRHGTAVKQWKQESVDLLEQTIRDMMKTCGEHYTLVFVQLLCAEMAKRARAKKGVR